MWTMPVPSSVVTKSAATTTWAPSTYGKGGRYVRPTRSAAAIVRSTTASAPRTRVTRGSARISRSSPERATTYVTSGWMAAAWLAGSVHGVVVHTRSDVPSSSVSGKRTYADGSSTSRYPCATSWLESAVPHRGQYGTTLSDS